MEENNLTAAFRVSAFISLNLVSLSAFAYVGPGTGLSAIGALLALVAALIVGIFGFLWYPIKRLMGKKKNLQLTERISETEEAAGKEEMISESEDPQK